MRKTCAGVIVIFFGVLLSFLCAQGAESVLRVRMTGNVRHIDPVWTTNYATRTHGYLVFDTLFALDGDYKIRPQMVDTYSISADGLVYTFRLRPGLKWHDGTRVTSRDCIASIRRWGRKDGLGRRMLAQVSRMEAVDKRSFTIVLKQRWDMVLFALAKISSTVPFMMPERLAKTDPDTEIKEVVGSGPFRMVQEKWIPGKKTIYVRNPDYVPRKEPASGAAGGKVVRIDRLEWISAPDPVSTVKALVQGEIHYVEEIQSDMLAVVEKHPRIRLEVMDRLGRGLQIVLNHLQPPFDNVKIRQAAQLALGQEEYMVAYFGEQTEFYKICGSVFLCNSPFESEVNTGRVLTRDPAGAAALLEQAGYDGTPVTLLHATDIPDQFIFGMVTARLLREAGFVVDDQHMTWGSVVARRANKGPVSQGGWHIFSTGWGGIDLMNPLTNVFVTGDCEHAWYGWHCSPALQALQKEFLLSPDPEAQKRISEQMQILAHDLVTFIPMGQNFILTGYSDRIKGLLKTPVPFFWNLSLGP